MNRRGCSVNLIVVLLFSSRRCAIATAPESQTGSGASWDAPESATYGDALRIAQCQAYCLDQFMEPRTEASTTNDISEEFLLPPRCEREPCRECFLGCLLGFERNGSCEATCQTDQCSSGCLFFTATNGAHSDSVDEVAWNLSAPEIVCYSLQRGRVSGVTLKWHLREVTSGYESTSNVSSRPLPAIFVTEVRTRSMASKGAQLWTTLGTRYQGLIPVTDLIDEQHQFRVTVVSKSGPMSQAKTSPWTYYAENASAPGEPLNVTVSKSTPNGRFIVSRLSWSTGDKYPSCNYALDILPDQWNVPSSHIKLSKPYDVFHYDIRGLRFDTNYTLVLRSTDTTEKLSSGPVTVWFKTPSCLDCYQFNFSLCAPGPPSQLMVHEVERPSSTWVAPPSHGLQIAWSPPAYASEENRVLGYQVTIEEERSIFDIRKKPTRRIKRTVNAETQQLSVSEILDGALYRVLVQAQSPAGLGQPAVTKYSRHAGYNTILFWSIGICVVFVTMATSVALWFAVQQRRRRLRAVSEWKLDEASPASACSKESSHAEHPSSSRQFLRLHRNAFRLLHRTWDTYEIPYETLELHEEIGRGAFSVVHRAHVWLGKVRETVAVKMLKDNPTTEERRNLQREIELLKLVGKHANVVNMRAYCTIGSRLALVVEYCPLGDLRTYLIRIRARLAKGACENTSDSGDPVLLNASSSSADSGIQEDLGDVPPLMHLLSLARQVAQGMEFLSSKRVVHRDLAARNVLLVSEHHAKIADLGLSRDTYEEGLYRKQGAGRLPARWMALESLSHMTYTTMSDVWSFGVLLWEVVSLGAAPYPGVANHQLLEFLTAGNRLTKPVSCPQETFDLMTSCWNASPICRPTFSAIVSRLDGTLEQSQEYFSFSSESE